MKNKHDLQNSCDHKGAKATRRTLEKRKDTQYDVVHYHCGKCGAYFSREDWKTLRSTRKESA